MSTSKPPQPPPRQRLLSPPLPMPTHPTQSGPNQHHHIHSTRSSTSLASSSTQAGPSRTGPYTGIGGDGPTFRADSPRKRRLEALAPTSRSSKAKGKAAKVEEKEEDDVELDAAGPSSSAKGNGKERARNLTIRSLSTTPGASESRRRVIPAPSPGEESEEEANEDVKERLSDYSQLSRLLSFPQSLTQLLRLLTDQTAPSASVLPFKRRSLPAAIFVRRTPVSPFPLPRLSLLHSPLLSSPPALTFFSLPSSPVCHLCLTSTLATTALRAHLPPPPPPPSQAALSSRWRVLIPDPPPLRHNMPKMLNLEGQCPVCREVLPGGLTGKGRRTQDGRARGLGFGVGGKKKEGEGRGVRRLEMRVIDC